VPLDLHECARFTRVIGECPFRRFKEDDDQEEERVPVRQPFPLQREEEVRETVPAFVPAARRQDRDKRQRPGTGAEMLTDPVIAHAMPDMRKALERMLPIQELGGFRSLPPMVQLIPVIADLLSKQGSRVESLRSSDSVGRQLMGVLMAIAVGALLRRSPGRGFNPSFATVQATEKRAAQESKQGPRQFTRKLFRPGGLVSSETFNETGFF